MTERIRVGIVGYGNLGRGVETAIQANPDFDLIGIFSRRDPSTVTPLAASTPVYALDTILEFTDRIDVLILCGGSKDDLPVQTPELAATFTVVDSYDTHAKIPAHFEAVNAAAKKAGTVAVISTGWDPGLFSLNRLYGEAIIPNGTTYTFWGRGLSQGHSDALRRVSGVAGGVQYTLPSEEAIARVRSGEQPELSTKDKHTRECYVVLADGADEAIVRNAIVTMPDYFEPYETTVHFISHEELARDHAGMPHGGFVIRSGESSPGNSHTIEYQLTLGSNPEFTSSVLVAFARAAARLAAAGESGAKTPFDIAPGLLSPKSAAELRTELL
ncbi:MAG: diaminopimelate dehydrogenase [Leucobacter sp.]